MFINRTVARELYNGSGETRLLRAKEYVKQRRVEIQHIHYDNMNNFCIESLVAGSYDEYRVHIGVKNGELEILRCECEDYKSHYGACKHIIATMLEIDGNPKYNAEEYKLKARYTDFADLINTFYDDEMKLIDEENGQILSLDKDVKIEPRIIYDRYSSGMKLEFKIGTKKQLYKLRDLVEFYENMINKARYKYGAKLDMIHEESSFCSEDRPLLEFIMKHAETIKSVNNNSNSIYRYYGKVLNTGSIVLNSTALDEFFEVSKNKKIVMEKDYKVLEIQFIDEEPKIEFELEKVLGEEYKLRCNIEEFNNYEVIDGKEYTYFLTDDSIYRCSKKYKETTLKLLEVFKRNYTTEIKFNKARYAKLFFYSTSKSKRKYKFRKNRARRDRKIYAK